MAVVRRDSVLSAPHTRSRVSNGKTLWINSEDGRSAEARRFRDILAEIFSDLGGVECLSEGQRQIARRCALLSVQCEILEAKSIGQGQPFSSEELDCYGTLTDRLGRAFQRLGLRRVPREVSEDVAAVIKRHATVAAQRDIEDNEDAA